MTRALLLLSCTVLSFAAAAVTHAATATTPNLKVAILGDQGLNSRSKAVLRLIQAEGADLALHVGDFDYADRPDLWDQQITDILGADYPYLGVVGNHDVWMWVRSNGYRQYLISRMAQAGVTCSGDYGVKAECRYRGLTFLLSGIGTWPVVDRRVAASVDDAEEFPDGRVFLASTDLEFMTDSGTVQRMVGMRWTNVQIPAGATISGAWLSLIVDETGSRPADIRIHGQASDAAAFATGPRNLSLRPRTARYVDWRGIPAWSSVGAAYWSPSLAPVIQEIVSRPGWRSGNSLALLAQPLNHNTGPRTAEAYDGSPGRTARLWVEYYRDVPGDEPDEPATYLQARLAEDESVWRICAWHKTQQRLQVESKINETGWGVYEACRRGGALVMTGHAHVYARTYLLSSFPSQTVVSGMRRSQSTAGQTFAAVSGLGGASRRPQAHDGDWWAAVAASSCLSGSTSCRADVTYGALFCTFHVDGDPRRARCYYKDINGVVGDAFDLISHVNP